MTFVEPASFREVGVVEAHPGQRSKGTAGASLTDMSEKEGETEVDLYEVLGAAKDDDQKAIEKKYKKKALKYHPDRNRGEGQAAAAEKFKEVSDAYAVLSDPNRRRQYDLHGTQGGAAKETNAFESVDVKSHNWATRFLLAQASKLGMPIPTTVSADVISAANVLADDPSAFGKIKRVSHGVAETGTVKISEAAFFRVAVDAAAAESGLLLAAKSKRKNDKFRLIVFDARGKIRRQAESLMPERDDRRRGAASKCRLFVVPRPTLLVGAPFPMAGEEHLPPICAALDTLEERPAASPPFDGAREYLVALYNDNLLSSLEFTLGTAPAVLDDAKLRALDASADGLRAKKLELNDFGDRFTAVHADFVAKRDALAAAQQALQELVDEAKAHETAISNLRANHDAAQSDLLETAFANCALPAPAPTQTQPKPRSTWAAAFGSRDAASAGPVPARGLDL